jgi:2-polyprenyl-6-methoxyphenol hydroxylase-like FAD-dependent oxidoreductase
MEVNVTRGRAIIIGAALAGLFAATLLRKAGWHTEVFERSDVELVGRGAGITTHPELLQSLVRSGADLNDLGVVVHERIALDAGGRRSIRWLTQGCRSHTFVGLERAPHVAAVITNLSDEAPLAARTRDALAGHPGLCSLSN